MNSLHWMPEEDKQALASIRRERRYIDELKTIYNKESDLRVPDVVKARIERGEWNPSTKIPMIIKISKGNIKFATEFIQNSLKIFTFPIVESSMYSDRVFSKTIEFALKVNRKNIMKKNKTLFLNNENKIT